MDCHIADLNMITRQKDQYKYNLITNQQMLTMFIDFFFNIFPTKTKTYKNQKLLTNNKTKIK